MGLEACTSVSVKCIWGMSVDVGHRWGKIACSSMHERRTSRRTGNVG